MPPKLDLNDFKSSFGPIKSNLRHWPIIGIDSEDDSKGTPTLFAFYGDFKKKEYWTKHWEDALDFILEDVVTPTIFVAHNLEYDIVNFFKGQDYVLIEEMIYSSQLLKVTIYGTSHFFINSSCFFKGPLKDMAKYVGLKKYDGDALDTDYVCNDAKIVYQFMKKFQKMVVDEFGVNLGVSIGQMAMNTFRRQYMTKENQVTFNSPLCLDSYYGGRVEIFYRGDIENVHVMDINSSYPFQMKDFPYPDTATINFSEINKQEFGIGVFKVFVPEMLIPPLPYRGQSGRLYFPTGEFTGCWTYGEMRYAESVGVKILKEYTGEGTNVGCYPFTGFMEDFYNKRLIAKEKEDAFSVLLLKLWMNNLYGKWMQRKPGDIVTRDKIPFYKIEPYLDHPEFKTRKIGPFYSYTIPKLEPPKTANFMWGTYVTSYARIHLHKGLKAIVDKGHTPIYCDTDSIMFSPKTKNFKSPLPISKKLGDWDIEKFDLGIFRVPKGYILCDKKGESYEIKKVACKGVPTNFAYDFILKGMAKFKKPMRFKEALITEYSEAHKDDSEFLRDVGANVWREVEKEMRSIDIKRKGAKGLTASVNAAEIPELEKKANINSLDLEVKNDYKIKKPVIKNNFENTVIPSGWFDNKGNKKDTIKLQPSQKPHFHKLDECREIKPGQIWICGHVLGLIDRKNAGFFYKIYLDNFKGQKRGVNFVGALRRDFLDELFQGEKIIGKYIEIILNKKYIENSSLDFRGKISNAKNPVPIAEEIPKVFETKKQKTEKLKAQDWTFNYDRFQLSK